MSEKLPPKPYRRVDIGWLRAGELTWTSTAACDCCLKGYADGFVTRHLMDYPCKPIRIVRYDGSIEFEHPGNGEVHLNCSRSGRNEI